jgi:hypothetical protein
MKKLIKIGVLAMCFTSLLFFGCKKEKEIETDLTSAEDQSQGEITYDLIFKQVDLAAGENGLKKGSFPIVTIDSLSVPNSMRIYYGETNFLCLDGNFRRGTIMVNWTGKYRQTGTTINIGFDKYLQNNNLIEGTKTVVNAGRNTDGNLEFSILVNGKITNSSGMTHTWNSTRKRVWMQGEETLLLTDDIYEITGKTSGFNRNGLAYTSNISEKLKVELGCEWRITSGKIEITPEGKSMRVLDFGAGTCDKTVSVTINGKTKTFERRK